MRAALLPDLTRFAVRLRRAGFSAGPGDLSDALRAAEGLGLLDFGVLEAAWGVIFARTQAQACVFPLLFRAHFLTPPDAPQPAPDPASNETEPTEPPTESAEDEGEDTESLTATSVAGSERPTPGEDAPDEPDEPGQLLQTRLSPHAGQGTPPRLAPDEAARYAEAARALLGGVRLGRSRRRRVGLRGSQVDVRATLQAARRSGGEPLNLRYRSRPPRPPRVVLLLDGSRSMAPYAALLLRYAAALSARSRKVEVYSFSTSLERLTPQLRAGLAASGGESWGGGTRIGENLARLLRLGRAHLRPDTLLLILSDGLDTGEPLQLAGALKKLRARVGGVVWLNPLAAQIGYLPLARGMAAALPHLDVFAGVDGVEGLLALPAQVRRALR
ncbi:VWA domain-containing protein [Deinococcus alpinitundrae]|uniref:VWA domain-containing protein n=1 Tax=Deinococcus alpinitundrae TaxID=468913 RepID=UPI00137A40D2|nr:VWA domain-containing protein [Deinococcus alpinitundrae]